MIVRKTIKNRNRAIALLGLGLCLLCSAASAQVARRQPPVIPAAAAVDMHEGEFVLRAETPVYADLRFSSAVNLLTGILGLNSLFDDADPIPVGAIQFRYEPGMESPEAYRMHITESGILIEAEGAAGAYYAVQTLRQMLPAVIESGSRFRAYRLPCMVIADYPRFEWRGVLVDCSRHFLPVEDVKKIIDGMALLKMNRFHWHLTDDQGWRLEIKAYPELTRVGAWRGEGEQRYGGYYTQEEVRDIVAFAAERQIIIVPEIDMPGHATAALASYPYLSCVGDSVSVATDWGIFETVMCPGKESTFEFVSQVLTEVAELFPGQWVHVGGDECMQDRWKRCSDCWARISSEHLMGTYALQWYFTGRVEKILASLGKTAIGWNEIMAGASTNTLVQAWYHVDVAVEAATRGFKVISSPIDPNYLNYHQGVHTLHRVYSFDPMEGHVWPDSGKALLGVECCLWAESLPTPPQTHRMLFPRIAAVAEAAWTLPENKQWESFRQRIGVLGGRWSRQEQEYYPITSVVWDDGQPLTADAFRGDSTRIAHIEFSAAVHGGLVIDDGQDQAAWSDPTQDFRLLERDSLKVEVSYARVPRALLPGYALRGFYKRSNVWAEFSDSTSYDGLFHLPAELAPHIDLEMECYPNPVYASGEAATVTLQAKLPGPDAYEISIHDFSGKCVLRQPIQASHFGRHSLQLGLGHLGSGIYFLRLKSSAASALTTLRVLR